MDWEAALLRRVLLAVVSIRRPVVDTIDFLRLATEAIVQVDSEWGIAGPPKKLTVGK